MATYLMYTTMTPETTGLQQEANLSSSNSSHLNVTNNTPCHIPYDFRVFINVIIIGILCLSGIVGNTLSILVLQKDSGNKVAVILLQALAVADNALLVISFVGLTLCDGFVNQYLNEEDLKIFTMYYKMILNPLGYMTQTATVWMTVLLAFNRYIAICKPFLVHRVCTPRKAKVQVYTVAAVSILFNVIRYGQWTFGEKNVLVNGTSQNVSVVVPTKIGYTSLFGIIYTNALYTILVLLLPLVFLVVLNTLIMKELARASQRNRDGAVPLPYSDSISKIMVLVVLVFLVCHTPDRILRIVEVLAFSNERSCGTLYYILGDVCNCLVIVNSSSNFIIYYVIRKRFREILRKRVCCFQDSSSFVIGDTSCEDNKRDSTCIVLLSIQEPSSPLDVS